MLEAVEAMAGLIIAIFIIGVFVTLFFIYIAAKRIGIRNSIIKNSLIVAISSSLVIYVLSTAIYIMPDVSSMFGFLFGIFLSFFIIKGKFETTLKNIFTLWIIMIIAQISAVTIAAILLIGGIGDFLKIV